MNWVDVVIILLLGVYALRGWQRGFLYIAFGLVGLLVSVGVAAFVYTPLTPLLERSGLSHNFAKALAFLAPWVVVQSVFTVIGLKWYKRIPRGAHKSTANRAAGIIPALIEGLILISLFALLIVSLPSPAMPREPVLNSTLGRPMVEAAAVVSQQASSIFGGAIRDALAFLTVEPEPTSTERINLNYKTTDVRINRTAEERMLELINRERTSRGLRPLEPDPELQEVARMHSRDMFAKGYFSHVNLDGESPFDRMNNAGITYGVAGENLALAPTVDIAHSGLMRSPGHRANILSPEFRSVGIGAIQSSIHGIMFTQNFRG
ncbi:MAG TPA: CvpA family protein [Armatimonadota bacterium]|nr:CvpA family protein [Armatimonadota bacterium]